MRIKYNATMNDRKDVATQFGIKQGIMPVYDRHTKNYVVEHVRFMNNGIVEGEMDEAQAVLLTNMLRDWEFDDNESRKEFYKLNNMESEYNIPDEQAAPDMNTEDTTDVEIKPDEAADAGIEPDSYCEIQRTTLTTVVSIDAYAEETYEALSRLIKPYVGIIQKVFGIEELEIRIDGNTMSFLWLKETNTPEENNAFRLFIYRLIKKAKQSRYSFEPVIAGNDEKYNFSRLLYRLGINGMYKEARTILMRNLDGGAWRNTTWKKQKAEREQAKRA